MLEIFTIVVGGISVCLAVTYGCFKIYPLIQIKGE